MKKRFQPCLILLVLSVGLLAPTETTIADAAESGQAIQVFLLAGQSNMEGQGVVDRDDPKDYNEGKETLFGR